MCDFDWKRYLERYPDLSGIKTQRGAWRHYQMYGKSENRFDKLSELSCIVVIAKYLEDISFIKNFKYPVKVYDKSNHSTKLSNHSTKLSNHSTKLSNHSTKLSINYPNVGREAETYLRYIIENYNNLPDRVIFLQGNPWDHIPDNFDLFNINIDKIRHTLPIARHIHFEQWDLRQRTSLAFQRLFNEPLPQRLIINRGAQYIVPRNCILCRSLEFYKTIYQVLFDCDNKSEQRSNCLVCPWTLERMWPFIFNPSIKAKEIKYNDLNI